MSYIRLMLVKPRPGEEEQVRTLLAELHDSLSLSPGLITSILLDDAEGDGQKAIGRLSIWRSKSEAERFARLPNAQSLRSRIRLLCDKTVVTKWRGEMARNLMVA